MKPIFSLVAFLLFPSVAFAIEAEKLIDEKEEIREELKQMSCSKLKNDHLPEIKEHFDIVKHVDRNSIEFELFVYGMEKTIEKSIECIDG